MAPAPLLALGIAYACLSGAANGLFTAPMKLIPVWKWENIWVVFVLTACLALPWMVLWVAAPGFLSVFSAAPRPAILAACGFGFAWGFGAILFGLSVDRLGVSIANSIVIGLSSALGSLAPLALRGALRVEPRQLALFVGVAAFLVGIGLCGSAGRLRDAGSTTPSARPASGYLFAVGAGLMSAVFNIGYSLALPIADAGQRLGYSRFSATNCIWLLMLGAGLLPNLGFCGWLLRKHRSGALFLAGSVPKTWGLAILMGVLWGASIFLYGAATPLLGSIGPSVGWPLSLAVALLVANGMGIWLGEWRKAPAGAIGQMRRGIAALLCAIALCAGSTAL